MPDDPRYRPDRGRPVLTGLAIADVVLAVPLLAKGFSELREQPGVDHVALQFAGGREAACRVIQPGATGCPVSEAEVERYAAAVLKFAVGGPVLPVFVVWPAC